MPVGSGVASVINATRKFIQDVQIILVVTLITIFMKSDAALARSSLPTCRMGIAWVILKAPSHQSV